MKKLSAEKLLQFKEFFQKEKLKILSSKEEQIANELEASDEMDLAQNLMIKDINDKLSLRERENLNKINEALKRIHDGVFGLCSSCEEPIADKRLEAIPHCETCIICAEEQEQEAKQYKIA